MQYIEINCMITPSQTGNEIIIALLADLGCESFAESEEGVLAYIPKESFDEKQLNILFSNISDFDFSLSYSWKEIEDQNWNAVWESNYEAVLIDNACHIRAPFHPHREDVEYEIEIEPKMSFGTAHHETTSQMIRYILEEDFTEKTVLDMGSGTGVLGILASLRGAKKIIAIDNDSWAYENCIENCQRNKITNMECLLGDVESLANVCFDTIIANINRNILLRDMEEYVKHLKSGGSLFLSGFYEQEDLPAITLQAEKLGLTYCSHKTKNQWVAAKFVKK